MKNMVPTTGLESTGALFKDAQLTVSRRIYKYLHEINFSIAKHKVVIPKNFCLELSGKIHPIDAPDTR
jgi:hypothetical protein